MDNYLTRATAIVDLGRIKSNIAASRRLISPTTRIMAVVKANAYGHGITEIGRAAVDAGCEWLSVATVMEGIVLRKSGIDVPILVMGATFDGEFQTVIDYNLVSTIFDTTTAQKLSTTAQMMNKTAQVHIKIDTGMNRLGFKDNAIADIISIASLPNININGIYSHFTSSEADEEFTAAQFAMFATIVSELEINNGLEIPIKHISNSGAVLQYPEYNLDMVRLGVLVYGLAPCSTPKGAEGLAKKGIFPALTFKSRIGHLKTIKSGESVGYGRSFFATDDMQIATIPLGYGDGVSRQLSNAGYVLVGGKLCPIVGTVCMDQMMVDATDADCKTGDEAVIIGNQGNTIINAETISIWQHTINYEITTQISQRVQRIYI
ncbi:MAG: alanine racemase [Defluviitaleaceae bacterium]|nr:alanine racemase [Defluviitaleaceae bacterium]